MPYDKFIKKAGERRYCIRNKETGNVTCFNSKAKREVGIGMKEAIHHGFKPTGAKGKGRIVSAARKRYAKMLKRSK